MLRPICTLWVPMILHDNSQFKGDWHGALQLVYSMSCLLGSVFKAARFCRYRKSSRPSQPSWKHTHNPELLAVLAYFPTQLLMWMLMLMFFVVVVDDDDDDDDDDDAGRGDNYVRMKVVIMFSMQYIYIYYTNITMMRTRMTMTMTGVIPMTMATKMIATIGRHYYHIVSYFWKLW